MPRTLLSMWLFAMVPALAYASDTVTSGKLAHIDSVARTVTLSDGSTYRVHKRVKLSARSVGETVTVLHRQTSQGREAMKIQRTPTAVNSRQVDWQSSMAGSEIDLNH